MHLHDYNSGLQSACVCKWFHSRGWLKTLSTCLCKAISFETHHSPVVGAVQVQKQSLTEIPDMCAIVHPTNPRLSINGGVSTAIAAATRRHRFEGTCSRLLSNSSGYITRGTAVISSFPSTPGTRLHFQHVIHAVLPPCSGKLSCLLGRRCTVKAYANVTLSTLSTSLCCIYTSCICPALSAMPMHALQKTWLHGADSTLCASHSDHRHIGLRRGALL